MSSPAGSIKATLADHSFVGAVAEAESRPSGDLIVESLLMPILRRLGRAPDSIFYFDIGASEAPQASNTFLFSRKYGATGVLVGADRHIVQALKSTRPHDQIVEATVATNSDAATTFNALFERYAARQIDFLSIDGGGVDTTLLEAINFDKYRPYIIRCEANEDSLTAAPGKIAGVLEARGYTLAARTETDLIFVDHSLLLTGKRQTIRSFDIFDTLIARNCIDPHRVFTRVEQLTNNPGFTAARQSAEQRIYGGPYNLDDIYDELATMRGWTQSQREAVQAAEIFAELEAVIPIAENIAQVRDGDVAVSDMYLPEYVIRMLLKKAGLAKEIAVVVSAHGKRSGMIWPLLLANHQIERHLGDNYEADVQSPAKFGIAARHTAVSAIDSNESWLMKHGLRQLAQFVRQSRLSTWHENSTIRDLQLIQLRFNFPILLFSSILLARFVAAANIENVLFCSRDCNLWMEIFSLVRNQMGIPANEHYFYTSRQARIKSTPSYRKYATELLQGSGVLVDVCGTGWSLAHMAHKLASDAPLYFIHHVQKMDIYESIMPTPEAGPVHSIVDAGVSGLRNVALEMCNYAGHPQVVDVGYIYNAPHPMFAPDRRSEFTTSMIREQRAFFHQIVSACKPEHLDEALQLPDATLSALVLELYQGLSNQKTLTTVYESMHAEEETDQLRQLRMLA